MHTPGPWRIDRATSDDDDDFALYVVAQDHDDFATDWNICKVYAFGGPDDDATKRNAAMIEAAPDMKAALMVARDIIHNHGLFVPECITEAIEKAEGE